jgi:hypothetical protein
VNLHFLLRRIVGPTKMIFLSSKKLGKEYENDIFLSNIKKWKGLSIQVGREK